MPKQINKKGITTPSHLNESPKRRTGLLITNKSSANISKTDQSPIQVKYMLTENSQK